MKFMNVSVTHFIGRRIVLVLSFLALSLGVLAIISCSNPPMNIIKDYEPDTVNAPDAQFGNEFAEDGNWPSPYIRPGGEVNKWGQIRARIDGDDTYGYWSSTDEVIAEFGELHAQTQIWLSSYDETEYVFTLEIYESQLWPFKTEYSLDRETTRGYHTNLFMREGDKEYFSKQGRIYDVKVTPDYQWISGKFEATLWTWKHIIGENSETRHVKGAFRGGFYPRCSFQVDEDSAKDDPYFTSEFCSQFRFLTSLE